MSKYIKIEKTGMLDNYIVNKVNYLKKEFYYTNFEDGYNDIRVRVEGVCYSFKIAPHELFSLNRTTEFSELAPCSILEDMDSEYLKDFLNRSGNINGNCNIKHYIIISGEDIIDVLSNGILLIERII